MTIMICVIGVAGAGKTTIGRLLAEELHCEFLDADSLHPRGNIEKMEHGIPLNDHDRAPWLRAVHAHMMQSFDRRNGLVVACSALKQQYRDVLSQGIPVIWVYLKGDEDTIRNRLKHRKHHFMRAQMLASQFADLEPPEDAIVIDLQTPPSEAVQMITDVLFSESNKIG
jgi:gluconokinase